MTSAEAQARVRRRYRAEARFRAYGLIALVIAAVFLVVLIADIVVKALPAFTQHSLRARRCGPGRSGGPAKAGPTPSPSAAATTSRSRAMRSRRRSPTSRAAAPRRRLTRLLSTGAADRADEQGRCRPEPDRQTVKVPAAAVGQRRSLFQGRRAPRSRRGPGRGIATPSGTSGEITVLTSANDFADDLVAIKRGLAERARQIAAEADRLQRLGSATLADRIKELREEAAGYRARVEQPKGEEELDGQPAEPPGRHQWRPRQDHQALRQRRHRRGAAAARIPGRGHAGDWQIVTYVTPESNRKATDQEVAFLERLKDARAGRAQLQLAVLRLRRQPRAGAGRYPRRARRHAR